MEIEGDLDDLHDNEVEVVKALIFASPYSSNTIAYTNLVKKEEIELVKRSIQIDEEIDILNDYVGQAERNFKKMFLETTKRRIIRKYDRMDIMKMSLQ